MTAAIQLQDEQAEPLVVAVVPAYNEERFIGSVVITALQYVPRVIVVDDGSSDRTALLARLAGADVIEMPENGGKARALNAGFFRAQEIGADAIVMLDADHQHDPSEIPQLLKPILEGEADVVIGSRFLEKESEIPKWRQVGQHALTFATNRASGMSTTDSQSGFRAFAAHALDLLHFKSTGLALESEMQFQLERSGLRVAEVGISVSYLDGNKRNPVVHGLEVLDAILTLVARRRPLAFLGLPGITLSVLGFLVGIYVVEVANAHRAVPIGTGVLSALLIIVGLLLTVTSVILHSIDAAVTRMGEEMHATLRQHSVVRRPDFN